MAQETDLAETIDVRAEDSELSGAALDSVAGGVTVWASIKSIVFGVDPSFY